MLEKYYDLMAYAYVFDNISEYLDIENISIHEYQNVWKIKLWETKDLIKWAKKAKYDYKTIKTLNPWYCKILFQNENEKLLFQTKMSL